MVVEVNSLMILGLQSVQMAAWTRIPLQRLQVQTQHHAGPHPPHSTPNTQGSHMISMMLEHTLPMLWGTELTQQGLEALLQCRWAMQVLSC